MRGSRRSEEQIIAVLKQAEKGMATAELCRSVCEPKGGGELHDWNGRVSDTGG